jgi:hypothetical protein
MQAKQHRQHQRFTQRAAGSNPPTTSQQRWWKPSIGRVFGPAIKTVAAVCSTLLFLLGPSGDWTWPGAWVTVLSGSALALLPTYLYLSAFNPDLIKERERFLRHKGTAGFDRHLLPAVVAAVR